MKQHPSYNLTRVYNIGFNITKRDYQKIYLMIISKYYVKFLFNWLS